MGGGSHLIFAAARREGEQAKVGVRPDIMLVWVIAFGGAGLLVPCVARGCDTCPPRPYPRPIGLL